MSESNRYYAVDIAQLTGALRGESARFKQSIPAEPSPVVREMLHRLRNDYCVAWDLAPLRGQRWEVYAELSHLLMNAVRLEGEECGWDAWSGRHRILIPVLDWNPLMRNFAQRWVCRPLPPLYFSRRYTLPLSQHTNYTESWPHGFFLRSEYGTVIPGLHAMMDHVWQTTHPGSDSPIARLRPGQPMPSELIDELAGDHDVTPLWQALRAARLYNALCVAGAREKDLFCIGY